MRAVTIYKILFIVFSLVLLAPFVIVPTISMLICLDITVFNPVPPPTDLNDFVLWKIGREKMCDWMFDFIPAFVIGTVQYGLYKFFFGTSQILQAAKEELESKKNTS